MPIRKSGFTLIELLVVVGIIAILSLIGVTIQSETLKNARDTKRKSDIEAISKALEAHYSYQTGYPLLSSTSNNDWFVNSQLPQDPLGGDYIGIPTTVGWTYHVCADLEKDGRGTNDTTPGFGANTKDFCRDQQL